MFVYLWLASLFAFLAVTGCLLYWIGCLLSVTSAIFSCMCSASDFCYISDRCYQQWNNLEGSYLPVTGFAGPPYGLVHSWRRSFLWAGLSRSLLLSLTDYKFNIFLYRMPITPQINKLVSYLLRARHIYSIRIQVLAAILATLLSIRLPVTC